MSINMPYTSSKIHTKASLGNVGAVSLSKIPKDLKMVQLMAFSRFPVYLLFSKSTNAFFAVKIFPLEKKQVSPAYISETRFSNLSHRHIIPVVDKSEGNAYFYEENPNASYILLQLAPYGNFSDLVYKGIFQKDEKLIRTYFKQLLNGLDYLHSKGISHLDLKLSNLLLGHDYDMKISDFDSAYTSEDLMVIGRGTKNFRAPEVLLKDCVNPKAADIYSCAIILFVMVTSKFPYSEDSLIEGHDFYELMISNKPAFWEAQAKVQGRSDFDKDFKEIFDALVKAEPEKRPTVGEIVKMKWMQGPCYTDRELPDVMSKLVKPKFISEEDLISAKKSSWTIQNLSTAFTFSILVNLLQDIRYIFL